MSIRRAIGPLMAGVLVLSACGDDVAPSPEPPAECTNPAPLLGEHDPRAPGFIVMFHSGVDAQAETQRLAAKYDFAPNYVFRTLPGFSAALELSTVAGIRCEESVSLVEHNAYVEAFARAAT